MKRPYRIFSLSCFYALTLLIVSCETRVQKDSSAQEVNQTTLSLNFHDNVLETNPLRATSQPERFIADLVYNQLFDADGSSSIIQTYSFDSIKFEYRFKLFANKTFHDQSKINSKAIELIFKHLIKNEFDKPDVHTFFSSLDGFAAVNWLRENRQVLDSLPRGFSIINDLEFSLSLTANNNIIEMLQNQAFLVFKKKKNSFIGSGPYELVHVNEDISAQLIKVTGPSTGIQVINLSFIKNTDLVLSEFFRGSLDLITFNSYEDSSSTETKRLERIIESKYPQFQVRKSNRTIICYAELVNIQDSSLFNIVHNSADAIWTEPHTYNQTSIESVSSSIDTSYQIPISNQSSSTNQKYFSDNERVNYIQTNLKKINPTRPHIVIKETTLNFTVEIGDHSIITKLSKQLKNSYSSNFLILDCFPEYVIYNNTLADIKNGKELGEMVRNMYFYIPETY